MNLIGDNLTPKNIVLILSTSSGTVMTSDVCGINVCGMLWPGNGLIKSMK